MVRGGGVGRKDCFFLAFRVDGEIQLVWIGWVKSDARFLFQPNGP